MAGKGEGRQASRRSGTSTSRKSSSSGRLHWPLVAAVPPVVWWLAGIGLAIALGGVVLYRLAAPATHADPRFQLTAEGLIVQPPPPPWIGRDLRKEVMVQGNLVGLNLLDRGAVRAVWRAFELHPWVREVHYASKRAGGKVYVELTYRRPVAMVSAPDGYFPVDADGVLLPSKDFDPSDPARYVEIITPYPEPTGDVGTPFGRPGVAGAARIAGLLSAHRRRLGLKSIHVEYQELAGRLRAQFRLRTAGGSIIEWGSAPGHEQRDESPARQKVRRLVQLAATRSSLAMPGKPQWIDVRSGLVVRPLTRPVAARR